MTPGNFSQFLKKTFISSLCIIFLMGSAINFFDTAYSGTNLISIIFFPLIVFKVFSGKNEPIVWCAIAGLFLLVFFALIATILDPNPANLRLLRGAIVSSVAVWGTAWVSGRHPDLIPRVLLSALIICFLVGMLQLAYLITGYGIDPSTQISNDPTYLDHSLLMGVPSIFGNPNDFSVFSCLIFLCYWASNKSRISFPVLLSFMCILMSGSKICIIISVTGLFIGKSFSSKSTLTFFFFAFLLMLYLMVDGFDGIGIYAIDRTLFALNEILSGSLADESSLSVRYQSWKYFLDNYIYFMSGAFNAGERFPQFDGAQFDDSLISLNPHSYIIELHALFGFGGMVICILMIAAILINMFNSFEFWPSFYIFSSILLLVNVSSSILGSGSTYALITLLVLLASKFVFKH